MSLQVEHGLAEHGLAGHGPYASSMPELLPASSFYSAEAMDMDSMLSMVPAPQLSDSVFRRWLLAEAGHGHQDVTGLTFCGPASCFDTLSTSSWAPKAPAYSQQVGSSGELLLSDNSQGVHLQGGSPMYGGPYLHDRCQLVLLGNGFDDASNKARHSPAPGCSNFSPAEFSNSANASFCASSINHSPALSPTSSCLSSVFGAQVASPLDFPISLGMPSCSAQAPNDMAHVSPVNSLSIPQSDLYLSPVPQVHTSGHRKFSSPFEQYCNEMIFSKSSDHQASCLLDISSKDQVVLSAEVCSSDFEFPSVSSVPELLSDASRIAELPQQEFLMNHVEFLPEVGSRASEPVTFGGYSHSEKNLERKVVGTQSRIPTQDAFITPQGIAKSMTGKASIVAGDERNLAPAQANRRRLKAPHKVFSPGSMKKVSSSKQLRRLESVWPPDVSPGGFNNHYRGSDRETDVNGLKHRFSTTGSDHISEMDSNSPDKWLTPRETPIKVFEESAGSMSQKGLVVDSHRDGEPQPVKPTGLTQDGGSRCSKMQGSSNPRVFSGTNGNEATVAKYDLLKGVAEALDLGNMDAAKAILARLSLELEGSPQVLHPGRGLFHSVRPIHDRVASLFKEALMARLSGWKSLPKEYSPLDVFNNVRAFKRFCEVSPVLNFAYFSANQAILEIMEGETNFHVIDFDVGSSGTQWASLLYEMAQRAGTFPPGIQSHGCTRSSVTFRARPGLRLTMVGMSHQEMEFIGDSLSKFAKEVDVELNFHSVVVERLGCLELSMLPTIDALEPLAVNIVFSLHSLLEVDDCSHLDCPISSPSPILKSIINGLLPKVVTVVEKQVGLDCPSFQTRFSEALDHYTLLLHSIGALTDGGKGTELATLINPTAGELAPEQVSLENVTHNQVGVSDFVQDSEHNEGIERFLFASEINDIIRRDRPSVVGIQEATQQWRRRLEGSGLRPRHLSVQTEREAECLLGNFKSQGFDVSNKEGSLVLSWQGHPLVASSAWVCL